MAFKRIATLNVQTVYAADKNNKFEWRSFVKNANEEPSKICKLPLDAYKFDTNNFLYLTARMISGGEKWGCNGNYDYFPWEEIKKAANTAIGKGFYIEHKEDSFEDAKGLILDVFPNDEEEFLVALCAIDKNEFPEFIQQILDGTYNQVSMSCLASECECSLCHNVAHSFDDLCQHMNVNFPITYLKGKKDDKGNDIYEINRDLCFTGLSSVAVPADKDAFVFDIKASKNKQNKLKEEFTKYTKLKQAGKMKEFKMACEENFKAMDNFTLLNKLRTLTDNITNTINTEEQNTPLITAPLQGIVKQLMELQIGLSIMDLNKLTQKEEVKEQPVAQSTNQEPLTMIEDEAENFGEQEEVNLDKEIESTINEEQKSFVVRFLENKNFDSEDDLEKVIERFIPRGKVIDLDSDGLTIEALEKDGKHIYKIYLISTLGGPHEDIRVEKVVELNNDKEINLDKEIDSYLDGDNYSYTPFSSTAKKENKMIKVIKSGTWAIPQTQREVEDLQELLLNPIKAEEAEDLIYDLVGDDELFDAIDAQIEQDPKADVRPIIINRLKELLNPEDYEQSMNKKIHKMLIDLVNK